MKYQKEHQFFESPNKHNSYWAGFIAADGNVSRDRNTLTITLSKKDKEHLQKFSKKIAKNYTLREWKIKNKNYEYVGFSLGSKKWKKDLKDKFGIVPQKTFVLQFPSFLTVENAKSFICGYIDGDGCIYVDKNRKNKIQLSICGNLTFLEDMKKFLVKEGKINFHGEQIYSTKKIYTFMAGGKTAMKILQFLYDDEIPLMKRKWDKFVKFLSNKALPLTHIGLKKIMIF